MTDIIRKLRAAPHIAFYKLRGKSSRDYRGQWESYWTAHDTRGGGALWDSEDRSEIDRAVTRLRAHGDASLPVLDLGCGNGRRTAWLAERFDRVIGVDVSASAVEQARANCAGLDQVTLEPLDITDRRAVADLAARHGAMNVHLRGVLHLISDADREAAVANLRTLLGDRGTLYFVETDGTALDYFLTQPGDSPSGLPAGMHEVIRHGILPSGFDAERHRRWFDEAEWTTLAAGDERITTLPFAHGEAGHVPAYFAVLRLAS